MDVIIRADAEDNFLFVASQSPAGKRILQAYGKEGVESVCLIEAGEIFFKSEAALMIIKKLAIPWRLISVFKIVPLRFRDAIYSFIAARRYRWFGRRDTCKVPNEKYKAKFIE